MSDLSGSIIKKGDLPPLSLSFPLLIIIFSSYLPSGFFSHPSHASNYFLSVYLSFLFISLMILLRVNFHPSYLSSYSFLYSPLVRSLFSPFFPFTLDLLYFFSSLHFLLSTPSLITHIFIPRLPSILPSLPFSSICSLILIFFLPLSSQLLSPSSPLPSSPTSLFPLRGLSRSPHPFHLPSHYLTSPTHPFQFSIPYHYFIPRMLPFRFFLLLLSGFPPFIFLSLSSPTFFFSLLHTSDTCL